MKHHPDESKINYCQRTLKDIKTYKIQGAIIRSKEGFIVNEKK